MARKMHAMAVMKKIFYTLFAALPVLVSACSTGFGEMSSDGYYAKVDGTGSPHSVLDGGMNGGGNGGGGEAGIITAAEWNDLLNWQYWGGLMTGDYSKMNTYWGLSTAKRVAVKALTPEGTPAKCVRAKLMKGNDVLWESVTDNNGETNLWLAVEDVQSTIGIEDCRVSLNGVLQADAPKLASWNDDGGVAINIYTIADGEFSPVVDIAFIVDATGSMSDEIAFLKEDLQDILNNAAQLQSDKTIFTGTVFYRDNDGDQYLTRKSEFTSDIESTVKFIGEQSADGGGDTPEAVHTALEVTLNELQWHGSAYSKLAFLVLDAPAHVDHDGVIASLQKSIRGFAEKGIRIIPVFCSSQEKECEFMCRQFAILTSGTYVFLTDDSGVGLEHVEPTVGDYQVEHLNTLMLRLITKYIK